MNTAEKREAEACARAEVSRAHTSFYWAMRLLPKRKRNAMYAIYAFCRVVDDIADGPDNEETKRFRLGFWRREIADVYEDRAGGPIGRALIPARRDFGLERADFLAVIDGMDMDVGAAATGGGVRMADLDQLSLYCDRVAGAVGRLANRVFGIDAAAGDDLARSLGRALQLTNILRDLREDAAMNRLYLPGDLLRRHGIGGDDPEAVLASPALGRVCGEIAALAEKDFEHAESLIAGLNRSRLRPVIIMKDIYRHLLAALVRRGWRDLDRPVGPSRLRRLWIVLRSGLPGR